jgi:SAM-dependent methyltransferase
MASNAEKIIRRYGDGTREEKRSDGNRGDYVMEYFYTKKILDRYITKESSVLEIGCGTGYYGLYLADKCKKYLGIDITPGNIDLFQKKINENKLTNVEVEIADAIDLNFIDDNTYDIVLVFGPVYHLPPNESQLVFNESKRICKQNGLIMFAYINKIGVYFTGCINEADTYPNKQKNQSLLMDGIDDSRDNIYWFTMPEEMEANAHKIGLTILDNLGVDFTIIPEMYSNTSERKEVWKEITDFLCNSKSCTGFANHAVMVCKKV